VQSATRTPRLGLIVTVVAAAGIGVALIRSDDGRLAFSTTSNPPATAPATAATSTTAPLYVIPPDSAAPDTGPPATDGGRNLLGGDSPEDKRMPDLVCMNLQAAQDEIQDHGVFFSKSVDASGKGRRQILDRNWIVVAQQPAAGEKIGEGDAVLSVVKKGEPNDCP
jgi:hypothetical protein